MQGKALSVVLAFWIGCSDDGAPAVLPDAGVCHACEFRVVHGWPELSEGYVLGQVSGVAIDSGGEVLVFHRADHPWLASTPASLIAQPALLRLRSATGAIEADFGRGQFKVPHGLRVDAQDHLWVTDVGLHQVFELSRDGEPLRSFGVADEPGSDETHFNQPTDVAIAADGSIYVADGYGNSRVVQLDAQGNFVRAWGTRGSQPGQFDTPHSIALDAQRRVYVADRGNARIQRFDEHGEFIDEWKSAELGRPWALTVAKDGSVFVVDGGDQNPAPPDRARILRLNARGELQEGWSSFGNYDGQIYGGHAIAVTKNGEVFVGDVYGMRVQKFTRR
ncbi:MAG TPA: peptidyl-alpha-hydroxyglycine alpha-amidating lyase family protein [Polyangiales bacterium]|nr:peptidyl-alpha-hydroxyglycine alpha-amidating lyase family protein [Polyangiales bacterium]